jgi:hypothetical protein
VSKSALPIRVVKLKEIVKAINEYQKLCPDYPALLDFKLYELLEVLLNPEQAEMYDKNVSGFLEEALQKAWEDKFELYDSNEEYETNVNQVSEFLTKNKLWIDIEDEEGEI